MSDPATTTVEVNGFPCRVWTKGSGPKLGFLAGFGGLPRWVPFLDELARTRTVIVPSLPGYPGGGLGHTVLDTHIDWVLAVRQIIEKAWLAGADLLGASVGAATWLIWLALAGSTLMAACAFLTPFWQQPGFPLEYRLLIAWGLMGYIVWRLALTQQSDPGSPHTRAPS